MGDDGIEVARRCQDERQQEYADQPRDKAQHGEEIPLPDGLIEGPRSGFGSSGSKLPGMRGQDACTL